MDLTRDFGAEFVERTRPVRSDDAGRATRPSFSSSRNWAGSLSAAGRDDRSNALPARTSICRWPSATGLSAAAVAAQVPALLPLLEARRRRARLDAWPDVRRAPLPRGHSERDRRACCDPRVVVLLIGERPGLATAESLSAYMAFRPQPGHTDAERNLISNIHARGVPPEQAAGAHSGAGRPDGARSKPAAWRSRNNCQPRLPASQLRSRVE